MNELEKAEKVLKNGGIVIYPTETVYAIGCLITFSDAIDRLYKIKHREPNQPTSVIVPSFEVAGEWVAMNEAATKAAKTFWPGPLTICLPVRKEVPGVLLGPNNTLGVRVPGNGWVLKLAQAVGTPILAPSANFKGEPPARAFAEIDKRLVQLVDYVVDTGPGGQKPSTIVAFAENEAYEIIREGQISKEAVVEILERKN